MPPVNEPKQIQNLLKLFGQTLLKGMMGHAHPPREILFMEQG